MKIHRAFGLRENPSLWTRFAHILWLLPHLAIENNPPIGDFSNPKSSKKTFSGNHNTKYMESNHKRKWKFVDRLQLPIQGLALLLKNFDLLRELLRRRERPSRHSDDNSTSYCTKSKISRNTKHQHDKRAQNPQMLQQWQSYSTIFHSLI